MNISKIPEIRRLLDSRVLDIVGKHFDDIFILNDPEAQKTQ